MVPTIAIVPVFETIELIVTTCANVSTLHYCHQIIRKFVTKYAAFREILDTVAVAIFAAGLTERCIGFTEDPPAVYKETP